ncbi:unnamed protein product [Clonostachys rhizophaga]|uniref:Uncharacterized protein n=1 Tax=Clonostachys rhizophaga TaxID=160324 RepID=A0A9N9VBU7_9HYPO|nr:unnamed protein product [Clonostachys rhizophaga]
MDARLIDKCSDRDLHNIFTLLLNGSHSHSNLLQPGDDVQHTSINLLKILVIGFATLSGQKNIGLGLFFQLGTESFNLFPPAHRPGTIGLHCTLCSIRALARGF